MSVEKSEADLSAYAKLDLAVNSKDIHDCFVITAFEEE